MRIDAKGTIGRYPALLVRTSLRHLRSRQWWGMDDLDAAAGLTAGDGRALVKALLSDGLIEAAGRGEWQVNPSEMDHFLSDGGQADHTRHGRKGVAAIPWSSGTGQQRPIFPRRR